MGLRKAMEDDQKVLIMGEDVGKLGGVFRITDGLQKDFGEDRVIDSPLAESGIVGTAVGLALRGYRPVVEIQFDGFVYPAYDQIVCQVAKMHYRSKGRSKMPMVIRIPFGGGIGAVEHHSESPEAQFAHTPGLKVVACSNPIDGYWMIQQAIASDDPVIFLEPKRQYHADKADLDDTATPDPLFTSRVVRRGTDATVLAYGPTVKTAMTAAEAAATEGTSLEVIDLRTLSPLDMDPVLESVRRTGRAVDHPRGAREPRYGAGGGRADPGGVLLLAGGAGPPGRRASTRRTPPPGSRRTTCPTSTGCSTPSTDRSSTEPKRPTWPTTCSPTSERDSPRPRSSPGGSRRATPSRSTTSWSRSRPPSRWSSCPRRSPAW